jgi:hypothetical protein
VQPLESPKEASILEDFSSGLWRSQFPRSFFEMSPFGQGERKWAATTQPGLGQVVTTQMGGSLVNFGNALAGGPN